MRGAVRHGVAGYILKPFAFVDLEKRLRAYAAERARAASDGELTQAEIDASFSSGGGPRPAAGTLPKGLSVQTAEAVSRALTGGAASLSATECAEVVGISRVSARRYLEHFVTTGEAQVSLRYGTTGRPERRYAP